MASHTRDGQLALTLQEGSVGRDELLRLTNTIPISKYSVFRSLATPSRLLLKNTKRKMFPIGCVIEFVLLRLSRWCCNSRSKTWGMDKEIGEHGVSNNGKRAELRENWASQISRSERMHQCALQYRWPNALRSSQCQILPIVVSPLSQDPWRRMILSRIGLHSLLFRQIEKRFFFASIEGCVFRRETYSFVLGREDHEGVRQVREGGKQFFQIEFIMDRCLRYKRSRLQQQIKSGKTYIDIANGDTARHFCGIVWGRKRVLVREGKRCSRLSRCVVQKSSR